jgi:hypothetical protein
VWDIACGAVVRRSAFLEVGGFDARLGWVGRRSCSRSTWLRRPLGGAARQTAYLAALAIHQPEASSGLLLAVLGLPWVLRERRRVPRELETALRTLAD